MLEKDASKYDRYQIYTVIGLIATNSFASQVALAAIAPVIVVICWYFALGPFHEDAYSTCIAILCILLLTAVNALLRVFPNDGREYLDMIEEAFGPQTRSEVWKWWQEIQSGQDGSIWKPLNQEALARKPLDIEAIAKQLGELRSEPSPNLSNRSEFPPQ